MPDNDAHTDSARAEQLGLWIGPFTAAVKAGAQTGFYRELAELTDQFIKMEASGGEAP